VSLTHPGIGRLRIAVDRGDVGTHVRIRQWLAEKEQGALALRRGFGQNAELDLQGRDALAGRADVEALLPSGRDEALFRRHPAVPVAQQDEHERAAARDLVQADLQHQQFARLFRALLRGLDAQPQIDGLEEVPPCPKLLLEARKHVRAQVVALGVHVAERGTDKDRARAPRARGRLGRRHRNTSGELLDGRTRTVRRPVGTGAGARLAPSYANGG